MPEVATEKLTIAQAVRDAMREEMERDERVLVLGEDVGVDGGVFRATDGLIERFGAERVIDTPLAESAIIGMSVGLAATGLRPVAEIQFMGFVYPAINQLFAHAARMRNRTRGRLTLPDGGPDALRRRHPPAGAPLGELRGALPQHARVQGRRAVEPVRRQGAADLRPSATTTRCSSWSRRGSTAPSARRCRRRPTRCRSARRRSPARATT